MLKFELGDYNLDIPTNVSVDFEFNQPAFTEDFIKGSGSYDITFDKTPTNDKALLFSNNLTAPSGVKLFPIKVHFGADTIINGILSLWESDEDGYVTTIEKSSIPFLINDVKIKDLNWVDIDMGVDTDDVTIYAKNASNHNNYTYPVRFPHIYAPNWYGENNQSNPSFLDIVNFYDASAPEFVGNQIQEDYTNMNFRSLVPCVTYWAILEQIAADYGYIIDGSAKNQTQLKNLCFLNNYSLDAMGDSYARNEAVSASIAAELGDSTGTNLGSAYTPSQKGTHLITIEATQAVEITNIHYKLCYDSAGTDVIIDEIGQHALIEDFTLTFEYYVSNPAVPIYVCAYRSNGLDPAPTISGRIKIENIGWNHLNIYSTTIHIPNHLPDITVSEFLNMYRTQGCLNIDFDTDNTVINFDLRETLLEAKIKTLKNVNPDTIRKYHNQNTGFTFSWRNNDEFTFTSDKYEGEFDYFIDLPEANDVNQYAFVKSVSAWYKVEYNEDTFRFTWERKAHSTPSYSLGDTNLKTIDFGASLAPMHYSSRICLLQESEAVSPFNPTAERNTDPIIFIYHGFQVDGTDPRPTGSTNSWNYFGEFLYGLQFEGTYGLFQWRLKEWYNKMLLSDEIEMQVYLKSPQIADLFNSRLYYKGVMMLLMEMDLSVNRDSILPSNLTLRKLG